MKAAEVQRPRGRPTKLDQASADRLVALLRSGVTLEAVAAILDVDRRTVQRWRARAWSRDPRDAIYVELEKRLREAPAATARAVASQLPAWETVAAGLELEHPERWGPVDE